MVRRVQWAQELTASTTERDRAAGYRLLTSLSDSDLASDDDLRLLYDLADDIALTAGNEATIFVVEDTEDQPTEVAEQEDQ